jgi:hypothetical protein
MEELFLMNTLIRGKWKTEKLKELAESLLLLVWFMKGRFSMGYHKDLEMLSTNK